MDGMAGNCAQPSIMKVNQTTNKAYIHCRYTIGIGVLDISAGTITKVLPMNGQINGIAIDEKTNRIFVYEIPYDYSDREKIYVIDGNSDSITSWLETDEFFEDLLVDSTRNILYGVGGSTIGYDMTSFGVVRSLSIDTLQCTPGGFSIRPSDGKILFSACFDQIDVYNPVTGIREASYVMDNGNTSLPIDDENGSAFVVVRGSANSISKVAVMDISSGNIVDAYDFGGYVRIYDIKYNSVSDEIILSMFDWYGAEGSQVYFLNADTLEIKGSLSLTTNYPKLEIDTQRNEAFVFSEYDNDIVIIDGATKSIARSQVVGYSYSSVAANSANHQAYALDENGRTLSIMSGTSGALIGRVPLTTETGSYMNGKMVVNPTRGVVYVGGINNIEVVDYEAAVLLAPIYTGSLASFDVDASYGILYFAPQWKPSQTGVIKGVNEENGLFVSSFSVGDAVASLSVDASNHNLYYSYSVNTVHSSYSWSKENSNNIKKLSLPSGNVTSETMCGDFPEIFSVNPDSGLIFAIEGDGFYFGSSWDFEIIDIGTGAVMKSFRLGNSWWYSMAVNNTSNLVYIADAKNNSIAVYSGTTGALQETIKVGSMPMALAVDQSNGTVYALNRRDGSLSIIEY